MNQWKKMLSKLTLLAMPFILYGLLILAADPFNYFQIPSIASEETKEEGTFELNKVLYKITRFRKKPCANILLGDSRANALDEKAISQAAGEEYSSVAFGGGKLPEMIKTFWYCAHTTQL